ncbi:sensor histidine kinase [Nocardioides sp. HDW12B]|uniref:sensor histidine kinase n=1 Tax=Nocardioides sp. HDW12B TaxID=2714939 RepID=UPI00140CE75E|nr:sensor histidine kinase [Nocardioides sp. HDW12B]QIK65741.1 sensor histidine kinase [Nocardioides sp. HDW12B]
MPHLPELTVERLRPPALRQPPWMDLLLAGFFVALTVAEQVTSTAPRAPWQLVLAVLAMAALAVRRQLPVAVAVLVVVSNLLTNPQGDFAILLSLVLVAFSVGFETDPPRSGWGLAVVLLPFLAVQLPGGVEPSDLAAAVVFVGGPWGVGAATRQRTRRAAEAMARAELLQRDQEDAAARAVAEERTRIARELHDVVSHSISVVTIQTQAVRRRLDPAQEREIEDLARIEATARDAMAEMRRLFGVLRTSGEQVDLAPAPGLGELPALVGRTSTSAVPVTLHVEGAPVPVRPGLDLAAFRVAQEALTNAAKHADATRVEVTLTWTPAMLTVRVQDDGQGAADLSGDGAGQGLAGMRERVALYGGAVDVTTSPGRGFTVEARFPLEEPR